MCYAIRTIITKPDGSPRETTTYYQTNRIEDMQDIILEHARNAPTDCSVSIQLLHCRVVEAFSRNPVSLN